MAQIEMTFIAFFIYTGLIVASMSIFAFLTYKNRFNEGLRVGKIEGKIILRNLLSKK